MSVARDQAVPLDAGTNLADLLNSALPQSSGTNNMLSSVQQLLAGDKKDKSSESSVSTINNLPLNCILMISFFVL